MTADDRQIEAGARALHSWWLEDGDDPSLLQWDGVIRLGASNRQLLAWNAASIVLKAASETAAGRDN